MPTSSEEGGERDFKIEKTPRCSLSTNKKKRERGGSLPRAERGGKVDAGAGPQARKEREKRKKVTTRTRSRPRGRGGVDEAKVERSPGEKKKEKGAASKRERKGRKEEGIVSSLERAGEEKGEKKRG